MDERRSKSWWKISCVGCVGLPCLSLMLAFGWIKCQVGKIGDQLPQEVAALKKMGVPVEPEDLSPNPPIPPGQNAKDLLEEIIRDLKEAKKDSGYNVAQTALGKRPGPSPEDQPLVVDAVAKLDPLLAKADRLASFHRLDFQRDYRQGAKLMFPEFAYFKEVAKWQAARSRVCVKRGDYAGSLQAMRSTFSLARLCLQEPVIIAGLVGIAIDTIGHAALANHLEAIKANQPALAEARKMLEAFPGDFDIKWTLAGDLVLGRVYVQSMRSWDELNFGYEYQDDSGPTRPDPIDRITLGDPAVRRMFEAKHLELWRKAHEQMPSSNTNWKGIQKALATIENTLEKDESVQNLVNQAVFPVFNQYANSAGLYQTRHRLSLLAIRLLQDRPGGLPKDLSKYGNLAIDPMDGKPIRYDRRGDGFKIWSVGRDEVDDKGAKFYPGTGMSNQNVDEVLHFFYPEKAPPLLKR